MRQALSGQAGIGRRTLHWAWWNCRPDTYICALPLQSWWHLWVLCWHWQACRLDVCTSCLPAKPFACRSPDSC